jgi:hypothetical protein
MSEQESNCCDNGAVEQKAIALYGGIIEIDQGELEVAFKKPDGLAPLLGAIRVKIEAEAAELPGDMSKAKNRAMLRSLAAKIVGSKKGSLRAGFDKSGTALLDAKKATIEDVTKEIKAISLSKKQALADCKSLHTETIAPAVEWEDKEKARKERLQERISDIEAYGDRAKEYNLKQTKKAIEILEGIAVDDSFQEFQDVAKKLKQKSLDTLGQSLKITEYEAAEATRKAKEKDKERDEKIAKAVKKKEEEKTEKIQKEAADKLTRETVRKEEAETKRKELISEKIKAMWHLRRSLEKLTSDVIEDRLNVLNVKITSEFFGEYVSEAAIVQTEVRVILAKAKANALEREKKQREDEDAETLRLEKEKEAKALKKKTDNKAHVDKIHDLIIKNMVKLGFDKDIATKIIFHVQSGELKGMEIKY